MHRWRSKASANPTRNNAPNVITTSKIAQIKDLMKVFIDKNSVPRGGFTYTEKTTGARFSHFTLDSVLRDVLMHRIANGINVPPGWEAIVEDEMCQNYVEGTCAEVANTESTGPRSIKMSDVKNFLTVASSWVMSGIKLVDPEEAEKRAGICAVCPQNQTIAGCLGCNNLVGVTKKVLGNRGTTYDGELKGCAVCSCYNAVQVHLPLEILAKGVTKDMHFPSNCWKSKSV